MWQIIQYLKKLDRCNLVMNKINKSGFPFLLWIKHTPINVNHWALRTSKVEHQYGFFLIQEHSSSLSIILAAVYVPDDLSWLDLCPHQWRGSIWSSYSWLASQNSLNESTTARPINAETLANATSANKQLVNLSLIECSPSKQVKQTAWQRQFCSTVALLLIYEFHHAFSAF